MPGFSRWNCLRIPRIAAVRSGVFGRTVQTVRFVWPCALTPFDVRAQNPPRPAASAWRRLTAIRLAIAFLLIGRAWAPTLVEHLGAGRFRFVSTYNRLPR